MYKFKLYYSDTGALPTNEHYLNFKYLDPSCHILFSVCQQGEKAVRVHFSSDKKGLRPLKEVINNFCEFIFDIFPWCEIIIAVVQKESVERIAQKCGFDKIENIKADFTVLIRSK